MEGVRCGEAVVDGGPGGAGTWGMHVPDNLGCFPQEEEARKTWVCAKLTEKASSVAWFTQIGEAFQGRRGRLFKRDFTRSPGAGHRCLLRRWPSARREPSVWALTQAPTANAHKWGCSRLRTPVHQRTRCTERKGSLLTGRKYLKIMGLRWGSYPGNRKNVCT